MAVRLMATKVREVTEEVSAPKADASNGTMPRLTREQILAVKDVATEDVFVPEWGTVLTVRGLTGKARDLLEARFADGKGGLDIERSGGFRAAMVAQGVIDEGGELLFRDSDVKALGEKSSRALQRVFEAVSRLSAIDAEDVDGIVADLKSDPSGGTG